MMDYHCLNLFLIMKAPNILNINFKRHSWRSIELAGISLYLLLGLTVKAKGNITQNAEQEVTDVQ